MWATFRAAVSLFILIGFFVFAFALIAGLMIGGFVLADSVAVLGVKAMVAAAVAALVVGFALWTVAFLRPQPKPGVDVTPEDAPELWALVTELSDAAGSRGPEQIRLRPDVNAAVSEDSRFLGLIGGPRRMYLGVPLLQGLSVTQLRAVLAHEFGHYSSSHTRLGPIAYRGWQAVVATVEQLQGNVIQWPLRFYAAVYILMSLAMSRSQERAADRLMVQVAGRANAQAALREIHVIATAWSFYMNEYIALGWASDLAPTADGFFGGFARVLAGHANEFDAIRAKAPPDESSPLDSHPPIAERIAVMETLPDRTGPLRDDDRPASALIPSFAKAAAKTAEETYVLGWRERLEWDELAARVGAINDERTANIVYETAARLAREPTATLGTVVALSEAGRAMELVKTVAPDVSAEALEEVRRSVHPGGAGGGGAGRGRPMEVVLVRSVRAGDH